MLKYCSITSCMKNMKGFTLIELMVTLAVIGVVAAVGLPQLQGVSNSNRLASFVNSLSGDINYTRSEAINRNTNVTISAIGGDWANGWTVTVDANPNPALRSAGPVPAGFTITEAANVTTLTYSGDGRKSTNNSLDFTVCQPGTNMRLLNISAVGRVSYSTGGPCP